MRRCYTSDEVVIEDPVVLRAMNAQLVEQCVGLEDQLHNRDLADFADVITDESRAFWADQLLANRDGAMTALNAIRGRVAVVEPVVVPAAQTALAAADVRHPLHNRATTRQIPAAIVGGVAKPEVNAAKIRNRAHEIAKAERVPFSEAFRRAEREIVEK